MWGNEINFRPATFYLGIADILATEVEGIKRDEEGGRDLAASPTRQGETGVDEQLQPTRESHDEHSLLDKGETVARETVGDAPDRDDTSKK